MGNQHLSKNVLKENYKSVLSVLGLVTNEKSDN